MSRASRLSSSLRSLVPWPAWPAAALFAALLALLFARVAGATDGRFVYPLDDAYIHLAIAKNWALHDVWGVTRHAFTSSTSSPLWTFLLGASFKAVGVRELAPLALNFAAGLALLALAARFLRARGVPDAWSAALLAAVAFFAPLPTLAALGMEHVLHAVLTLAFARLAAERLAAREGPGPALFLLAALVASTRYEGLFVVFAASIGFLRLRRIAGAFALGASAALPLALYGLWSMAKGWYFLPNSVLLKGGVAAASLADAEHAGGGRGFLQVIVFAYPALSGLLAAALALALIARRRRAGTPAALFNLLFLASALLHLNFARLGWFFRYEAYLIVWGLLSVAALGFELRPRAKRGLLVAALAAAALCLPLAVRGSNALRLAPLAARNIYEQQYQTGLFLRAHYSGKTVVLNDIGAPAFLADIRLLDVWGLAAMESARLKRAGAYDAEALRAWTRREAADLGVVYDVGSPQLRELPEDARREGRWRIRDNVVCGSDVVAFYALRESPESLRAALADFGPGLPPRVEILAP